MELLEDYREELISLQRQRDILDDKYRQEKRYLEEQDEILINQIEMLNVDARNSKVVAADQNLQEIYSEQEEILRNLRRDHMDYADLVNEKYNKKLDEISEQENLIRKELNNNEDNKEAKMY